MSTEDIKKRFDDAFGVPTVYYNGDKEFFKDDYTTPISEQDLKAPALKDSLLELAEAFSNPADDGIVTDIPLIESDNSIITTTVIWCDVREKIVKSTMEKFKNFSCNCQSDGSVSVTYNGHKIVFNRNKYHGVILENVRIKRTMIFYDGKSKQYRYVDVPLKKKYLSLVDDNVKFTIPVEKREVAGRYLEYRIKLK